MAWKVHRNGFGTTTDTRVERMNTSVGTAVPAKRVGLASERVFLGTSALLFMASAGATIYWSGSMSSNRLMSNSRSMSIVWMGMLGQTWLSAAASFMAMWVVMMVAMMLPSLVPTLLIYRRSLHAVHRPDKTHLGGLTALAGTGYFFVWALFGTAVYPLGVALTTAEMQWMALANLVPIATGVVLLLAGCFQLTAWKAHQLECCRGEPAWAKSLSSDAQGAWRYGLRLGVHCILCCAGFMVILLVTGVMDLGLMVIVAAAITIERFVPRPERVACVVGVVIIVAGVVMIARSAGIGLRT
jgi:predicted metal-binding membrane protein